MSEREVVGGAAADGAYVAGAESVVEASFSVNGTSQVAGLASGSHGPFVEFNPDMPELAVKSTALGVEERAAVRVAMAQAAEELAALRGAGSARESQGSASSAGLDAKVRARRNWILSSGQMRSDFQSSRARGWSNFSG